MSEERDPGQLTEPLAESVLEYNLRLRPTTNPNEQSCIPQELERVVQADQLAQFMDREFSPLQQNSTALRRAQGEPSIMMASSQGNNISTRLSHFAVPWDQVQPPAPSFLQGSGDDWWQVNLDNLGPTMLPYSDLYDLNFNM